MSRARVSNRIARYGRINPGGHHLAGSDITGRMQRQYEDILQSLRHYHRYRTDAKRKQVAEATVRKLAKQNPLSNDEAQAIEIAEQFHGRPVDQMIEVEEEEKYTEYGGGFGCLQRLDILMEDGRNYQSITFECEPEGHDNILVTSDPKGKNIEFVGGDQCFDWRQVEGAGESEKHLVLVGPVCEIDYWADKWHLGGNESEKAGMTYFHKFGDEGGALPWLVYDTRNCKLLFVGGDYTIEPEGITG